MNWLFKHYFFKRFVILHLLTLIGLAYYWDPIWILLSLVGSYLFALIGYEIAVHRYVSHRSFTCSKNVEIFLLIAAIFSLTSPLISFAKVHRVHHMVPDSDDDPHIAGTSLLKIWFQFYDKLDVKIFDDDIVSDLRSNKLYSFVNNWSTIIYLVVFIITACISIKFALYFFIVGGLLANHTYSALTILCHSHGQRNFDTHDKSTNNPWCRFMLGAELHNNHHEKPWSFTTKVFNNDIDMPGWLIKHVFATTVKE